jgi:hypothetical protein
MFGTTKGGFAAMSPHPPRHEPFDRCPLSKPTRLEILRTSVSLVARLCAISYTLARWGVIPAQWGVLPLLAVVACVGLLPAALVWIAWITRGWGGMLGGRMISAFNHSTSAGVISMDSSHENRTVSKQPSSPQPPDDVGPPLRLVGHITGSHHNEAVVERWATAHQAMVCPVRSTDYPGWLQRWRATLLVDLASLSQRTRERLIVDLTWLPCRAHTAVYGKELPEDLKTVLKLKGIIVCGSLSELLSAYSEELRGPKSISEAVVLVERPGAAVLESGLTVETGAPSPHIKVSLPPDSFLG